jgi:hypothetical protein
MLLLSPQRRHFPLFLYPQGCSLADMVMILPPYTEVPGRIQRMMWSRPLDSSL